MVEPPADPQNLVRQLAATTSRPAPYDHGRYAIRITRDGHWHYNGSPIRRKRLVRLFSTVLMRDDDGQFWLQTPVEKGRIDVDDAPFTAVAMDVSGDGRNQTIRLRTNVDDWVTVDAAHPLRIETAVRTGEPAPYVLVREGLEALLLRPVFYDLVALGVDGDGADAGKFGVWSGGRFFVLGDTRDWT